MNKTVLKRVLAKIVMRLRSFLILCYGSFVLKPIAHIGVKFCDFILARTFGNRFIEFELSSLCNAKCIFCFYPDIEKTDKPLERMTDDNFDKAAEKIKQLDYSFISFTPTTGDVLVNKKWYEYIYKAVALDNIRQITFYTNAIMLNSGNQDRLIELLKKDKKDKIFALFFSVGGLDRDTYNFMFGVDKFDLVAKNINEFLEKLKSNGIVVGVNVEFRNPKNYDYDEAKAKKLFNKSGYSFVYFNVLNRFMSNNHLPKFDELEYLPDVKPTNKACAYLTKTRFSADGSIWADGCVVSEVANDQSLKLGTVDDPLSVIEAKRSKIIESWETKMEIPTPCKGCTFMRVD